MRLKSESLLRLGAIFCKELTDFALESMLEMLVDITDEELDIACSRAAKASKFMPSIAELRDLVMDHRAAHPPARKRSPPITKDKLWARLVAQDKQEMGDMTDEEYEKHKAEYLAETGEEWLPPGWNPKTEWNEDGTQKGL